MPYTAGVAFVYSRSGDYRWRDALTQKPFRVVGSDDGASPPSRRPLRIFIADDRDAASMLAALMRDEGHEVHTVLRGDEVLDLVRLFRPDALAAPSKPGMPSLRRRSADSRRRSR
jgi:PleD family two-component response regulator